MMASLGVDCSLACKAIFKWHTAPLLAMLSRLSDLITDCACECVCTYVCYMVREKSTK